MMHAGWLSQFALLPVLEDVHLTSLVHAGLNVLSPSLLDPLVDAESFVPANNGSSTGEQATVSISAWMQI